MGTSKKEIEDRWRELEAGIEQAGLSVLKFAARCGYELDEIDDQAPEGEKKFIETFKKQLNRKGASPKMAAKVDRYLQVLYQHPDYIKRVDKIAPRIVDYPEIDSDTRTKLRHISETIEGELRFMDEGDN